MNLYSSASCSHNERQTHHSRPSSRRPRPARNFAFRKDLEFLETRLLPTGNITLTNALVVDANGQPLNAIGVGEVVSIQADFSTQGLPSDASYSVGFTVNGLTQNSGTLTWGAGSSSTSSFNLNWGGFVATPGINQVTVNVDPDHSVPETTYTDNAMSFTFSAAGPATGSVSYTVAQLRAAYGLNSLPDFGTIAADGSGQTIALDEAGNDPNILSDLDGFDEAMSLSTQSTQTLYEQYGPASSIVSVYNQAGTNITASIASSGSAGVPAEDPTGHWEAEETMDVEWAHAMAPGAKIDVIEVNDDANWPTNLLTGDTVAAVLPGVSVISNSWGLVEWSGETAYDSSTFVTPAGHEGVTFLTASNDNGANVYPSPPSDPAPAAGNDGYYPATSPNVVSVGGTELAVNSDAYGNETGWSFPAPSSTVANGSSSYTQTGNWSVQSGGFSGTYSTAPGGSASSAAWTISVNASNTGWGTELSATWTASPLNATDATYTVHDGTASGTILGTVVVNQSQAPVGNVLGSTQFQELGVFFPTLSTGGTGTLTVVLSASSAGSRVVADAIGSAPAWASTGGPSPFESEPLYQLPVQNSRQRTTPDVAFDASENSGVTTFQNGALSYGNFGTSLGSPCWAGLFAIANQGRVAAGRATFNIPTNPTQALQALYSLPASDFHEITSGYSGFSAGAGYNEVTGLGSPIANLLIPALVSYGASSVQFGRLVIAIEPPSSVAAGSPFGLTVSVQDSAGNVMTSYDAVVAISLATNPTGATLGGSLTALVSDGVATFSGLTISKAGSGYTLSISGGSVSAATTNPITVTPGSASSPTSTSTSGPGQSSSSAAPGTTPPPAPSPTAAPSPKGGPLLTQTTLTTRSKSAASGARVTLTAMVKIKGKARKAPAGTVTFTDGSIVVATVPLQGGRATFTTTNLPIGRNALRAAYAGASNIEPSRSALLIETVHGAKSKTKLAVVRDTSGPGRATIG